MTNRGKKITGGVVVSGLLLFALPFLADPSCAVKPMPEEPPLWSKEVTCPFAVIDETHRLETEGGTEWHGAAVIRLEHVSEHCPGHTLEIRRKTVLK